MWNWFLFSREHTWQFQIGLFFSLDWYFPTKRNILSWNSKMKSSQTLSNSTCHILFEYHSVLIKLLTSRCHKRIIQPDIHEYSWTAPEINLVTVMLMTSLCWWLYVGDFFRYGGDFFNVLNRSPTSWIGHQHLKLVTNTFGLQHPSPTSM